MRISNLLTTLAALATVTLAIPRLYVHSYCPFPIFISQDDITHEPTEITEIPENGEWSEELSTVPGIAVKITPLHDDIWSPNRGVLTVGYTYTPNGWIYYDLGVHLYYPFDGFKAKLFGNGGGNFWDDEHEEPQKTVGYHGETNLYLELCY